MIAYVRCHLPIYISEMELPSYASTLRNRVFISNVLGFYLPKNGCILETASGTGEHLCFFSEEFPLLRWQPSDKSSDLFWAISKRSKNKNNIKDPVRIDLTSKSFKFKKKKFDAVLNINMIHIAPWDACIGLFKLASEMVHSNGFVYLYGPFKMAGVHTSASNNRFDVSLKQRNAAWGVRNLEDVVSLAKGYGFPQFEIHDMPANNKSIIFKKQADSFQS